MSGIKSSHECMPRKCKDCGKRFSGRDIKYRGCNSDKQRWLNLKNSYYILCECGTLYVWEFNDGSKEDSGTGENSCAAWVKHGFALSNRGDSYDSRLRDCAISTGNTITRTLEARKCLGRSKRH